MEIIENRIQGNSLEQIHKAYPTCPKSRRVYFCCGDLCSCENACERKMCDTEKTRESISVNLMIILTSSLFQECR